MKQFLKLILKNQIRTILAFHLRQYIHLILSNLKRNFGLKMAGGKLNLVDVFAMSVNSSIGSGILAVPWVFLQIGPTAGIIFTILFYFLSTVTSLQMVENISL